MLEQLLSISDAYCSGLALGACMGRIGLNMHIASGNIN
jgi:hypothetical protein